MNRRSYCCVAALGLFACASKDAPNPASSSSASAGASTKPSATQPATTQSSTAPIAGLNLDLILGTPADGHKLKPFAGLKGDMSPAQAMQALPNLGDEEYGVRKVLKDLPEGVHSYELMFDEKKLQTARVVFRKDVSTPQLFSALVAHLNRQLAPTKGTAITEGKLHSWVVMTAELSWNVTVDNGERINDREGIHVTLDLP
jgi:hypothetical protein